MSALLWIATLLAASVAAVLSALRWLRVSQREHYLPGSAIRFALRWWSSTPLNLLLGTAGLGGAVASLWWPPAVVAPIVVGAFGPVGLSIRGRSSQLAWTRRLRTEATLAAGLAVVGLAVGIALSRAVVTASLVVVAVPGIVDLAAAVLAPIEDRLGRRFVEQANVRLARVAPRIVGITGSYGKTSTKNHLATLIGRDLVVVASPRSFNNRAGLSRAVNEHLAEGTDVFIAEMGTYGPGEIAELCDWCPPSVAVITAIGPVHLERFGSLERTLEAKSEITRTAEVVVLNIDDELLSGLAEKLAVSGKRVIRASSLRRDAEVVVRAEEPSWAIEVEGAVLAACPLLPGVQPTNVACAIGAAMALGIPPEEAARRVASLSGVENRLGVAQAPSGLMVIDDTFNSNPAGAAAALDLLEGMAVTGRRVVVTPGMVELGPRQAQENRRFARRAGEVADVVIIVGRTNRRALRQGLELAAGAQVVEVATRDRAVAWVRSTLGAGDAVLYENDLPDNYP